MKLQTPFIHDEAFFLCFLRANVNEVNRRGKDCVRCMKKFKNSFSLSQTTRLSHTHRRLLDRSLVKPPPHLIDCRQIISAGRQIRRRHRRLKRRCAMMLFSAREDGRKFLRRHLPTGSESFGDVGDAAKQLVQRTANGCGFGRDS